MSEKLFPDNYIDAINQINSHFNKQQKSSSDINIILA